jgi:hypothetical protein
MGDRVAQPEFALDVLEGRRTQANDEFEDVGRTRDGPELIVGFPAYRTFFPDF